MEPAAIAGVIAGDGHLSATDRRSFALVVQIGSEDRAVCDDLRRSLGVGTVRVVDGSDRRPVAIYRVRRLSDLVEVVVPLLDQWLPECHKRRQFEVWRDALLHHWEHGARRRRTCAVHGCDRPHRARGLCRHHYYRRWGR